MPTTLPDTSAAGGVTNASTTIGQQKTNIAALRDFLNDLFGTSTASLATVHTAFRLLSPELFFNGSLTFSVASNALTIALKTRAGATAAATDPVLIGQRNATGGSGDFNLRAVTGALSMVVSSGSTLGMANADSTPLYVYLLDNAGTQELAVSRAWFGASGIMSTTAEGGAGAADSGITAYSTTSRSNLPFRLIARLTVPQTTAGTWAAVPTVAQLIPFAAPGPTKTRYTSGSGTYTTPPGCVMIERELWGGGASGGSGNGAASRGTGGGGGEYSFARTTAPSATYSYAVGAGGAAVAAGPTAGNVGGDTSFGTQTAKGGTGGTGGNGVGAGGQPGGTGGVNGDFTVAGEASGPTDGAAMVSGGGSSSRGGFGGKSNVAANGQAPGGGGAAGNYTGNSGAGAAGAIVITEYYA